MRFICVYIAGIGRPIFYMKHLHPRSQLPNDRRWIVARHGGPINIQLGKDLLIQFPVEDLPWSFAVWKFTEFPPVVMKAKAKTVILQVSGKFVVDRRQF